MDYPYRAITTEPWKLIPNPLECNAIIGRPENYLTGFLICDNLLYDLNDPTSRPDEFTLYNFLKLFESSKSQIERKVTYYYTSKPSEAISYIERYVQTYLDDDADSVIGRVDLKVRNGSFTYIDIDTEYYRSIFYPTAKIAVNRFLTDDIVDGCKSVYYKNRTPSSVTFDKFLVNVFDNNVFTARDDDKTGAFRLVQKNRETRFVCSEECWTEHIVPLCFFLSNWTLMLGVLLNLLAHGECTFGKMNLR